jgi:predicted nucleic acid-binding protein
MRESEPVFVDTGAWIALALTRDPFHTRAQEAWENLQGTGARLHTSVPVILETFTFLDRNTVRDVALTWQGSPVGSSP